VAIRLNNLGELLRATNRLKEAEPLYRRALEIDEKSYGHDHSNVATDLSNLAQLLHASNRSAEAEPLMRRVVEILLKFTIATGYQHPDLRDAIQGYGIILGALGRSEDQAFAEINKLMEQYGMRLDS